MRGDNVRLIVFVSALAYCLASLPAYGQQPAPRKSLTVPLTETPPLIDGVIEGDEWDDAVLFEDFHQFEPDDNSVPSEASVVWIKYDKDYLYIAARHEDSEPSKIVARQLMHGQSLQFDDAFEIVLDPFNSGHSGYNFQTNPNGMRHEALYENTTELNRDWDTIWATDARITDDGWETEMAIPFKSISFDPDITEWGFTAARTIARKREELAWTSYGRRINPSTTGLLEGIREAEQGIGLDLIPSIVARRLDEAGDARRDTEVEPSLDVFYKFTPALTGVLTINTDFAATEVDDREVNLTRFDLFLAEKRAFFLQDADLFSFGGLQEENGLPFFSRRIGLNEDGEPLDISAGVKLTGRVRNLSIGLLGVSQEQVLHGDDEELFVGKLSYDFLEQSRLGVMFTSGDPLSDLSNRLWGVDYQFRTRKLITDGDVVLDAWFQQSTTDTVDADDSAWGLSLDVQRGEGLRGRIWHKHIEENFLPALGFVNRTGIQESEIEVSYVKRLDHRLLRSLTPKVWASEVSKTSGELESRTIAVQPLLLTANRGDTLQFTLLRDREVIDDPFELVPGVVVGTGDYTFDKAHLEIETAQERKLAASVEVSYGDFYDGDRLTYETRLNFRPNRHIHLGLEYEVNDGEVSGGKFRTRLISLRGNFAFNAKWSLTNYIQYDNVSETAGINSRLRWNRRAGQDMYIVFNQGFERDRDRSFTSSVSELSLKVSYAIRF